MTLGDAAPPPPVLFDKGCVNPGAGLDARDKTVLLLQETESQFLDSATRSLISTPTELSRILKT
jgi:hypothetical protein